MDCRREVEVGKDDVLTQFHSFFLARGTSFVLQFQAKAEVGSRHNLSLKVVDLQEPDCVGTVVPRGDDLVRGHGRNHLLFVLDLLRASVTSEDGETASDRWR